MNVIKQKRKELGISQRELSEKLVCCIVDI